MEEQNNTMNALFDSKSTQCQPLSEYDRQMATLIVDNQYPQPGLMPNGHRPNTTTTIICENRSYNYLGEDNMPNKIKTNNLDNEIGNNQKQKLASSDLATRELLAQNTKPSVISGNTNAAYLQSILLSKSKCESLEPSVIRCIGDLDGQQLDFVANMAWCFAKRKKDLPITATHVHLALKLLFDLLDEEFSLSSFSYTEVTQ